MRCRLSRRFQTARERRLSDFDRSADRVPAPARKVTVVTKRTIDSRPEELRGYLRAMIRAFWFMRDTANFDYLRDLESRLRSQSHNDEERRLFIVTTVEKVDGWALPIDGGVTAESLIRIIQELVAIGDLKEPVKVESLLYDAAVREAYQELVKRPELRPAHDKVKLAVEKYGF
jgi:hypothetical protein